MASKKQAMKSGLEKNVELALVDLIGTRSGRGLFAHILQQLDFMEVVADVNGLIAQGVGKDLFDAAAIVAKGNALKVIEENFLEGGAQHVRGSNDRDDDRGDRGDQRTDRDFELDG